MPYSDAVFPTRLTPLLANAVRLLGSHSYRAISPRFAINTEASGRREEAVVEACRTALALAASTRREKWADLRAARIVTFVCIICIYIFYVREEKRR